MSTTDNTADSSAGLPAGLPPGARFDPITGAEVRAGAGAGERRQSFALQPGEPVASFNLVTSMMPMASGTAPQTYRWALAIGILIPVVAGALGYLAFAFVAAALVVPAVYLVYMYDVNQWEDEPLPVVLGAVGVAAALGVGFTFLWHAGILGSDFATVSFGNHGTGGIHWDQLLVMVLLVPIAGEVCKQVGPLVLASRPAFDDMIDGLTFGVAAGASFAAAETIVVNRSLFSSFGSIDHPNSGFWVSLILSAAIVKPIVYGAATGIAVASFSGLGAGYDGFKPGYVRGLAEALVANILFQGGLFFAARIGGTSGAVVGLIWGALVAAVLVVRLRYFLHFAVLESALEAASTGNEMKDSARGTAFCPSCEMPLVAGANFCVVCGTSVRAGNKATRVRNRVDDTAPVPANAAAAQVDGATAPAPVTPPPPVKPTLKATPAGQAPRDNRATALVVGAVAATIVLGGAIGQAAAAAGNNSTSPGQAPITLPVQPGRGPTTPPAPSPANPPGPTPDPQVTTGGSASLSGSKAVLPGLDSASPNPFPGTGSSPGIPTTTESSPSTPTPTPSTVPTVPTTTTSGSSVDLGGGLGFAVPDGWTVAQQEAGFAEVDSDGGVFLVSVDPPTATLQNMVSENLQILQNSGIQSLQVGQPSQVNVPSSDIVQAYQLGYQGVLASQQGGTVPVQGFAFYFLLQDGRGVTAFSLFAQGAITSDTPDTDPLVSGYNAMLNSLVSTM